MAHSSHHILSSSEGEFAEMFEVTGWGTVLQFLLYEEYLSVCQQQNLMLSYALLSLPQPALCGTNSTYADSTKHG